MTARGVGCTFGGYRWFEVPIFGPRVRFVFRVFGGTAKSPPRVAIRQDRGSQQLLVREALRSDGSGNLPRVSPAMGGGNAPIGPCAA